MLKGDEIDDNMRLVDITWAIQMDFNVYEELTEIGLRYHTCTSSFEVTE